MEFLNPGLLGNQSEFKRNFFIPIQAGRDTQAADRLRKITGPFILRRLKTDKTIISDLPDKMEMKVFCTLTREQASLYAAVLKDLEKALLSSKGIQRKGLILGIHNRARQIRRKGNTGGRRNNQTRVYGHDRTNGLYSQSSTIRTIQPNNTRGYIFPQRSAS